jgi:hypothetical protein
MAFEPNADGQALLKHVPENGDPVGNTSLRKSLGWDDTKFWSVRDELIEEKILILGRGRGGSVRRNIKPVEQEEPSEVQEAVVSEEDERRTEQDFYKPIEKVLNEKWSKDLLLEEFFIQITAKQGRRETGGTWTRPDIVAIYVSNYQNIPGKFVNVATFEVKTHHNCDVTAIYEALAHLRTATSAYVLIVVPKKETKAFSELLEFLSDEARRHGIGLIVTTEPDNYDTWEFAVEAETKQPDPAKLDEFIESQISDDNKRKLRKWIK